MELTNEQTRLFDAAIANSASDIHLVVGEPPIFRINGDLVRQDGTEPFTATTLEEFLLSLYPTHYRAMLQAGSFPAAETSVAYNAFQMQLCTYRTEGNLTSTIRILLTSIPPISAIGGDRVELFQEFAEMVRGLILITGPTGSGKQTTAFAILEEIAQKKPVRIYLTREVRDIEYSLKGKLGIVSSLVVGQDVPDYESAAQLILRGGDPDIVYMSDLPTLEAARSALTLARTGHLVIANAAAESAAEAIMTLCQAAPDTLPELLAEHLVAVTNQRLLPRAEGKGRVPAYEVLRNTAEIRELIRSNADAATLTDAMQADSTKGMRTLGQALQDLVDSGSVTQEAADASI